MMLMLDGRTFLKRKGGLFKKAHELSVLCSVDVAVIIFGHNKKLYDFSSGDINETIGRFQYVSAHGHFNPDRLVDANPVHSTEELMNIKDRPTSLVVGTWTTMTMMIWARRHSKTPCHPITTFLRTCKTSPTTPT